MCFLIKLVGFNLKLLHIKGNVSGVIDIKLTMTERVNDNAIELFHTEVEI